jgi:hypothetical protein
MAANERTPNLIYKIVMTPNEVANRLQCIIKWHQDKLITLRAISCKPLLYESYWNYVFKRLEKKKRRAGLTTDEELYFQAMAEKNPELKLVLFDVDIVRGSFLQKDDYYMERYKFSKEQKEVYFGPDHKNHGLKFVKR